MVADSSPHNVTNRVVPVFRWRLRLCNNSAIWFGSGYPQDSAKRFWAVEHPVGMLAAIVFITVGHISLKNQVMPNAPPCFMQLRLFLFLPFVPWPMREAVGRPWFPAWTDDIFSWSVTPGICRVFNVCYRPQFSWHMLFCYNCRPIKASLTSALVTFYEQNLRCNKMMMHFLLHYFLPALP